MYNDGIIFILLAITIFPAIAQCIKYKIKPTLSMSQFILESSLLIFLLAPCQTLNVCNLFGYNSYLQESIETLLILLLTSYRMYEYIKTQTYGVRYIISFGVTVAFARSSYGPQQIFATFALSAYVAIPFYLEFEKMVEAAKKQQENGDVQAGAAGENDPLLA
ncbi:hypothetical protein HDU97_000892 [Phlyctochytrium planicorne]|nr:hypothetical protein HDU97_000880 [Phlyctochytrium planicorne]KAJ3102049.1 hypothetical protein HDU97_000892 [Phlyctochytrium planicorne]